MLLRSPMPLKPNAIPWLISLVIWLLIAFTFFTLLDRWVTW